MGRVLGNVSLAKFASCCEMASFSFPYFIVVVVVGGSQTSVFDLPCYVECQRCFMSDFGSHFEYIFTKSNSMLAKRSIDV